MRVPSHYIMHMNSTMINTLLIVCVGNICRSPIGEALFRARFAEKMTINSVSSAGLHAMHDWPADPIAVDLMLKRGLDISQHRGRQLTPELVFNSDLILVMSSEQQEQVENSFPGSRGRVHRIGKWGGYDVVDPYRRPGAIFEQALALIEQGVNDWCTKLGI